MQNNVSWARQFNSFYIYRSMGLDNVILDPVIEGSKCRESAQLESILKVLETHKKLLTDQSNFFSTKKIGKASRPIHSWVSTWTLHCRLLVYQKANRYGVRGHQVPCLIGLPKNRQDDIQGGIRLRLGHCFQLRFVLCYSCCGKIAWKRATIDQSTA